MKNKMEIWATPTTGNPRWNNPNPTNPTTGAMPRGLKNLDRRSTKQKCFKILIRHCQLTNMSHDTSIPRKESPDLAVTQDYLNTWCYNQSSLYCSHCLYKSLQTNNIERSLKPRIRKKFKCVSKKVYITYVAP